MSNKIFLFYEKRIKELQSENRYLKSVLVSARESCKLNTKRLMQELSKQCNFFPMGNKSITISTKYETIQKIPCLVSRRKFINAFLKLHKQQDVMLISFESTEDLERVIDCHFKFTDNNSCKDLTKLEEKVRWSGKYSIRLLIFFLKQLIKQKVIGISERQITPVIKLHFSDSNGNPLSTKAISDAKNKITTNKGVKTNGLIGVPLDYEYAMEFVEYLELSRN